MKKKVMRIKTYLFPRLLGIIICFSIAFAAEGQTDIKKPDLRVDGSKLIIEYEILNDNPNDRFEIGVIVTDEDGNRIDANSLKGDIGTGIKGGLKKITWEYWKDDIRYETTITVNIEYEKQAGKPVEQPSKPVSSTKTYSRSGLILQSIALPGLGMTKLKGKPFWIYGVAGYGLGGYALFNYFYNIHSVWKDYENGDASYEDYENAYDDYIYYTLGAAGGAAVIWLTDIVLVTISSKNVNKSAYRNFQIAPGYDYRTQSPLLTMTYKF